MTREEKGMAILLVDDEAEFASTLAERLNLRNYRARVAFDGESALELLEAVDEHGERGADAIDLVLLDMFLPGMHGLEVLRRIHGIRADLPVVLLTGQAGARDGIEGMKEGAKGYLSKPVDLRELLEVFESLKKEGNHA